MLKGRLTLSSPECPYLFPYKEVIIRREKPVHTHLVPGADGRAAKPGGAQTSVERNLSILTWCLERMVVRPNQVERRHPSRETCPSSPGAWSGWSCGQTRWSAGSGAPGPAQQRPPSTPRSPPACPGPPPGSTPPHCTPPKHHTARGRTSQRWRGLRNSAHAPRLYPGPLLPSVPPVPRALAPQCSPCAPGPCSPVFPLCPGPLLPSVPPVSRALAPQCSPCAPGPCSPVFPLYPGPLFPSLPPAQGTAAKYQGGGSAGPGGVVWRLGYGDWGMETGVWRLGYGDWGMKYGVWRFSSWLGGRALVYLREFQRCT